MNLRGPVYYCHAAIGHMIRQKSGVIINLGLYCGTTGTAQIEYGTPKSGIIGLTRSLAIYGGPYGVRACCVSPGPVKLSTLLNIYAQKKRHLLQAQITL